MAVATKGEGRIDQHFGHAKEFQIYEADGVAVRFVGHRKIDAHYCQGGLGEDSALASILQTLEGVDALLCAKIGDCPSDELAAAGIVASDEFAFEFIEPSIAEFYVKARPGAGRRAAAKVLVEPGDFMMLMLTRQAVAAIVATMNEEGKQGFGVRVSAEVRGCSGPTFGMRFEEEPREGRRGDRDLRRARVRRRSLDVYSHGGDHRLFGGARQQGVQL